MLLNSGILLLILLWSGADGEKIFNITKYRFCEMLCTAPKGTFVESDACRCRLGDDQFTVLKSEPEFREMVLDVFNTFRNKIAMGEYSEKLGKAADMMVLNYDLELEYLCYCKLRAKPTSIVGCFRPKYQFRGYLIRVLKFGEYFSDLNITKLDDARKYITKIVEDGLSSFEFNNPSKVEGVVMIRRIVYSKMVTIGCARVVAPTSNVREYQQYIGCILSSYSAMSPADDWFFTEYDYVKGDACTNCVWMYPKCGTEKYPGLCGTLEPVPTEALPDPEIFNETITPDGVPADETPSRSSARNAVLWLYAACLAYLLF